MSETVEEGMTKLERALELVRQYGLTLRLDKCKFLQTEIDYLGFYITRNEIRPQSHKTEAVDKFPVPTTAKQVQRFLGLAGYFRRFIPSYSTVARPLSVLTKKEQKFEFGAKELEAFERIKNYLSNQPVLGIYSPQRDTELHTDASSYGYGAVLLQRQDDQKFHPVYYMSATTTDAESRYNSFELEMLAIVRSLEKFRPYLLGIPFKLVTDCNSLKLALSKREINSRIFRWSVLLEDFNYTLEHRSSKNMQHVDALSRTTMIVQKNDPENELRFLKLMQERDPEVKASIDALESEVSTINKNFILKNGLLCYQFTNDNILFVCPRSMRHNVVRAAHDDNGHIGLEKTIQKILESYWFPKMRRYVSKYLKHCIKCLTFNPDTGIPTGYLNSIPKGNIPFLTLHCDHFGPLNKSSAGYRHILVVIDAYSKFIFLNPTKSTTTRETIEVMRQIFKVFGPSKTLISDRGSAFTSDAFSEFLKDNNVTHIQNATATPRANGQCERYNRTISNILAKLSDENGEWHNELPEIQHILNNTYQRSIATTPARILFGYDLRVNSDQRLRDLIKDAVQEEAFPHPEQRQVIRDHAECHQARVQQDNEKRYNLRRRPPPKFVVGDYVLIKSPIQPNKSKKLQPKYKGPYIVTKVLDHDRFVVEDIPGAQVSQRFYSGVLPSDSLRPYIPDVAFETTSSDDSEGDEDLDRGDQGCQAGRAVGDNA